MADLTIHFLKPDDWADDIHIHLWDTGPKHEYTSWPGWKMKREDDGSYAITLPGIESARLVINDAHGHQTHDLLRHGSGWLKADGSWFDEKPDS